jgi:hypothetical protein
VFCWSACTGEVSLPPLATGTAQTLVFAYEDAGAIACSELHAQALDLSGASNPITLAVGRSGGVLRYYALLLEASLSDLGLSDGPLSSAMVGPSCGPPDASTSTSVSLTLNDRSFGHWQMAPPDRIAGCVCFKKNQVGQTCPSFHPVSIPLPATGSSPIGIAVNATTALAIVVGTGPVALYRIGIDVDPPSVSKLASPQVAAVYGAAFDGDRTVWFGGSSPTRGVAALWRGPVDQPFGDLSPLATSTTDGSLIRIDAPRDATMASDVYALGTDGHWLRFERGRARTLATFPGQQGGATMRVGPSEALVVETGTTNLRRFKNGIVTEEVIGLGREKFAEIQLTPFGLVVASATGSFYASPGSSRSGWVRLGQTGLGPDYGPRKIVAYEDGFVFAGFGGYVGQFRPGIGPCGVGVESPYDAEWVVRLGRDLLVGGDSVTNTGGPVNLVLLRRQ